MNILKRAEISPIQEPEISKSRVLELRSTYGETSAAALGVIKSLLDRYAEPIVVHHRTTVEDAKVEQTYRGAVFRLDDEIDEIGRQRTRRHVAVLDETATGVDNFRVIIDYESDEGADLRDPTVEFNLSSDGSVHFSDKSAVFLPHQDYLEIIEHDCEVYPADWRTLDGESLQDAWLNVQDILIIGSELNTSNHLSML